MDVMNFKVVSLVIVVEVILSFYWLSINQQEAFRLRVALPLRVTPSGEPGKNFSRKNQAPFQRVPLRVTPSDGPGKNSSKDQVSFHRCIYADPGGRLGNNLYSLAATYHCAKKASNHHANLPLEMYSFTL